jgi:hypothetical protein
MREKVSFADIKKEFEESLGYIHNDIEWLCEHDSSLNYTIALLIGCACEALSDGGAYPSKQAALADLLPDDDWKRLAAPLFDSLRNGLAHSFDTKHLQVGTQSVQIYMNFRTQAIIVIESMQDGDGLILGTRPLAKKMCQKIKEFETKLRNDPEACRRFRDAMQRGRTANCPEETWIKLKSKR